MSWDFLRLQRDNKPKPSTEIARVTETAPRAPDAEANAAEVHILRNFDPRAMGAARDTVRTKLNEFEDMLQALTQLPDAFRQVMSPIENAINSMTLLRNRLEVSEEVLAAEQLKSTNLSLELTRSTAELERVQFQLKNEESAHGALRERTATLETSLSELRHDNADLTARIARIDPLLREASAARDAAESELVNLRAAKAAADEELLMLRQEVSHARQDLATHLNLHNELTLISQRNQERLEAAQAHVSQLEATLTSVNQKLAQAVASLQKERNTSRQLRADHEQLMKECEETKLQFDTQLDASRARYQFVEKMLEESRARFSEETRQLASARRERAQRDRELGQMTLQIETLRREMAELRGQVNSSNEALSSTSGLLGNEVENRRKLELEIDILRAENSSLVLRQKLLTENERNSIAAMTESNTKFQNRLAALRAENDQLRSELNAMRDRVSQDAGEEEVEALASDNNTVVAIR